MSQFLKPPFLNYDALIDPGPDYLRECPMCLTNTQVQILAALAENMAHQTFWYSPTDQTFDTDLLEAALADIVWRLSDMGCGDYYTTRIDDNGDWQISNDGGETWTDATPGQDPRSAIPVYAALPGANGETKRCEAANSIITRYKQVVSDIHDNLESGASEAAIAAILTGLLLILGLLTGGWAAVVLGPAIVLIAFEITLEAWDDAYNDTFWQQLICILYDEMEANASYTRDGAAALLGRIQSEMPDTIARHLTELIVKVLWNLGLTNMARSGLGGEMECDCADCLWDWFNITIEGDTMGVVDTQVGNTYTGHATYVPAIANPPYAFAMSTEDDHQGCHVVSLKINDVEQSQFNRTIVPDTRYPDVALQNASLPQTENLSNAFGIFSESAFTVEIVFSGPSA